MVRLDVGGDGRREKAGAGVSSFEALAEVGGGDVFVDGGEEVDPGTLGGGQGEWCEFGLCERRAGAADYDPLGEGEEFVGGAPAAKVEEAVSSAENKERCGGVFPVEGNEEVDGVVGRSVGVGPVEGRWGETGIDIAGEGDHCEAVGEGGGGGLGFEGLAAGGRE